jgi:hypothetical protein
MAPRATSPERPSIIGTINHMGHGIAVTEAHSFGTWHEKEQGAEFFDSSMIAKHRGR